MHPLRGQGGCGPHPEGVTHTQADIGRCSAAVRFEKSTREDGRSGAVGGHHHLHTGEVAGAVSDGFVGTSSEARQLLLPMTSPGPLVPVAGHVGNRRTIHDPGERHQVRERDLPRHLRRAADAGIGRVVNEDAREPGLNDRLGPVGGWIEFGPSICVSVALYSVNAARPRTVPDTCPSASHHREPGAHRLASHGELCGSSIRLCHRAASGLSGRN